MNLAPCPDCGNDCSLLAQMCPKCGRPFQPGDLKSPAEKPLEPEVPEPSAVAMPLVSIDPKARLGCVILLIGLVVFIVAAIILQSANRSRTGFDSTDYTPVGTGSGSGNSTTTDVSNNPCYRSCATRMSANPDALAPQCRDVTPMSEYQKCIRGAAASISALCLRECGLK